MKTFACGDVIPGCSARFSAADEGAILAQVAGHAAHDHGVTDVTPGAGRRRPQRHRQHLNGVAR
jgi:predicted small metal-binding protein